MKNSLIIVLHSFRFSLYMSIKIVKLLCKTKVYLNQKLKMIITKLPQRSVKCSLNQKINY
jgi:hypothetical protein